MRVPLFDRPRKDVMDLMTFYRYRVEPRPHAAAVETAHQSPTVASITRRVKP
jgi:hypothetical protein